MRATDFKQSHKRKSINKDLAVSCVQCYKRGKYGAQEELLRHVVREVHSDFEPDI